MTTPNISTNRFIGAKIEKEVSFLGQKVKITKLTVSQILNIQSTAKANEGNEDPMANLSLVMLVLKEGAKELSTLTDDEFKEFPMEELTSLSNEIMSYSGLAGK